MSSPPNSQTTPQKTVAGKSVRPSTPAMSNRPLPASHAMQRGTGSTSGYSAGKSPMPFGTPARSAGKTIPGGKTPASSALSPNVHGAGTSITDSPSALMALDSVTSGGVPMGLSVSNLGLGFGLDMQLSSSKRTMTSKGRISEAERRQRMDSVMNILSKRPGRISQEGVERLGKRMFPEFAKEQVDGKMLCTLAGSTMAIDVQFASLSSPKVDKVALHFHGMTDPSEEHIKAANRVLQRDLQPPSHVHPINTQLNDFADNLERLSRMDKLSVAGANCFEAITGVYNSLKRLYDHEKQVALALMEGEDPEKSAIEADRLVMLKRNGRPRLHARNRIGLSVDYFQENPLLTPKVPAPKADSNAMDVDSNPIKSPYPAQADADLPRTYRLLIEAEACPPALYPPLRTSSEWLSPAITRPAANADPLAEAIGPNKFSDEQNQLTELDWTDPPATTLPDPTNHPAENVAIDPLVTAPLPPTSEARFVAKLEPPIALPLLVACQLYASVDIDILPELQPSSGDISTWDSLVLPLAKDVEVNPNEARLVHAQHSVPAPPGADNTSIAEKQKWEATLNVPAPYTGKLIESIPFSHPKQIIGLLGVLRQYATIQALTKATFGSPAAPTATSTSDPQPSSGKFGSSSFSQNPSSTFMSSNSNSSQQTSINTSFRTSSSFPSSGLHNSYSQPENSRPGTGASPSDTDLLNDLLKEIAPSTDGGNAAPIPRTIDLVLELQPSPHFIAVLPSPSSLTSKGMYTPLKVKVDVRLDGDIAILLDEPLDLDSETLEQQDNENGVPGAETEAKRESREWKARKERASERALQAAGEWCNWGKWMCWKL